MVRVHTCNQRSEGYIERKCRCRKFVSHEKATELMDDGYAKHIITLRKWIEVQIACPMCNGQDQFKRSCGMCGKSGVALVPKLYEEYGEDIYMRPFLKTPRTATIEEEHIEYAYVKGDKDALKRIELYNELTLEALINLGAALIRRTQPGKNSRTILSGRPEPEDDPKTGTGCRYDYGRSEFSKSSFGPAHPNVNIGKRISMGGFIMKVDESNR